MTATTKVLIKAVENIDKDSNYGSEFTKLRKTLSDLPGLNYGITYRHMYPNLITAIAFAFKVRFLMHVRVLTMNISRRTTTDGKTGYTLYVSLVKRPNFKPLTDE